MDKIDKKKVKAKKLGKPLKRKLKGKFNYIKVME